LLRYRTNLYRRIKFKVIANSSRPSVAKCPYAWKFPSVGRTNR
jgi:hypothetical protein